jgi:hypothetical protein
LKLREQMSDVRLDGLLRQEETLADFAIHQPVSDELKNLDLSSCGVRPDFACGRGCEWDNRSMSAATPTRSSRFESATVIAVAAQDLFALGGVHESDIGAGRPAL